MLRRLMRGPLVAPAARFALAQVCALVATTAHAAPNDVPDDFPRLVLDTGRTAPPAPDPEAYRFFLRGEEQIRYQALRSFPLVATASAISRQPNLVEQSIGQNQFVYHWLRVTPEL